MKITSLSSELCTLIRYKLFLKRVLLWFLASTKWSFEWAEQTSYVLAKVLRVFEKIVLKDNISVCRTLSQIRKISQVLDKLSWRLRPITFPSLLKHFSKFQTQHIKPKHEKGKLIIMTIIINVLLVKLHKKYSQADT